MLVSSSYHHGACLNRSPMHHLYLSAILLTPLSPPSQYQCFIDDHPKHHPLSKHQLRKISNRLIRAATKFPHIVTSSLSVSVKSELLTACMKSPLLLASPLQREQRCNFPAATLDPTKAPKLLTTLGNFWGPGAILRDFSGPSGANKGPKGRPLSKGPLS